MCQSADRVEGHLLDEGAQVNTLVYTETNPVSLALVARADHWPGARCGPGDLGCAIVIQRPKRF